MEDDFFPIFFGGKLLSGETISKTVLFLRFASKIEKKEKLWPFFFGNKYTYTPKMGFEFLL